MTEVVEIIKNGFPDDKSFDQRKQILDGLLGEGVNHFGAIEYNKDFGDYIQVWALLWKPDGDVEIGMARSTKAYVEALNDIGK